MLFNTIHLYRNIKLTICNEVFTAQCAEHVFSLSKHNHWWPSFQLGINFSSQCLLYCILAAWLTLVLLWGRFTVMAFTRGAPSLYMYVYLRKGSTGPGPNLGTQDIFNTLIWHQGKIKVKLSSGIAGACKTFIGPSDLQDKHIYKPKPYLTGQDLRTCG